VSSNAVGRTVARIAAATGAYEDEQEHDGFELEDFNDRTRSRYPLVTPTERTSSDHLLSPETGSHRQAQVQASEKSGQGHRGSTLKLRLRFWVEALRRRQAKQGSEKESAEERKAKMKFSHSIQFNAVPDWSAYYIAYSNLKKLWGVICSLDCGVWTC
jgi:phosphate transporter